MNRDLQCFAVPDKALPGETQDPRIPICGFVRGQNLKRPAPRVRSELTDLYNARTVNVDEQAAKSLSKFLGNSWGSFGQGFIGFLVVISLRA